MKLDCLVIQFAKFPRLGEVKTRLRPLLQDEGCYQFHLELMTHTNQTLNISGLFNMLALDQLGQHELINALAKTTPLILQEGNDLGAKMKNAMAWGLDRASKVIIIGSDCPVLTPQHFKEVQESLNINDHVFIPAEDGGYVLIAATQVFSNIYENIDWGTQNVMQQTKAALTAGNKKATYLSPLWDIDRPEDYQRLMLQFPNWPDSENCQ